MFKIYITYIVTLKKLVIGKTGLVSWLQPLCA